MSSRAMSRVPVTRRKMMKMLMILSRDRSNHTTIWGHRWEEIEERGGGRKGGDREQIQSQYSSEEVVNIQWSDTWRNLCPSAKDSQVGIFYSKTVAGLHIRLSVCWKVAKFITQVSQCSKTASTALVIYICFHVLNSSYWSQWQVTVRGSVSRHLSPTTSCPNALSLYLW